MARVILLPPFAGLLPGEGDELTVPGATIFALVRALDERAPGFAEVAELGAAIAVNGLAVADWTTRLDDDDEVLFVPKVAGGRVVVICVPNHADRQRDR